jgi:hypothetical protein
MVRVEVLRATSEERTTVGVPTQEETVKAPAPVEAAGVDVVPHIDSDLVNEVEPQLQDAPGEDCLIPWSPRGPSPRLPRGTTSDDMTSFPGSLDIVYSGVGELGLAGYPRAPPLPASWR